MKEEQSQQETFQMSAIGHIRRNGDDVDLQILEPYRPALKELDQFSHVLVFWWASHFDGDEYLSILQCEPPYALGHTTGVFATRSPIRPNPIAMTTCKLLGVDEEAGLLTLAEIDAFDGTPVVDVKAYFPVCDRVQEACIPAWLSDWPEWMPEEGIGLMEGEG
jgi:tRNA-Thr(GGU) m(6)t(6)A37 methyltransferase TsaA